MINSDAFAKRLKKIMEFYQLSSSAFAERIQVQRSSISHLLSGRNKPSLDFVLKVTKEFHDVELYWLLNGKGDFPKSTSPISESIEQNKTSISKEKVSQKSFEPPLLSNKNIDRIVIFYSDGTFNEYLKEVIKS